MRRKRQKACTHTVKMITMQAWSIEKKLEEVKARRVRFASSSSFINFLQDEETATQSSSRQIAHDFILLLLMLMSMAKMPLPPPPLLLPSLVLHTSRHLALDVRFVLSL